MLLVLLTSQTGVLTARNWLRCCSILSRCFSLSVRIQCCIIIMRVLDRLLQQSDPQQIKAYQSYVQLHLKLILTTINKNKLEDTTQLKIRKYKCVVGCYSYFGQEGGQGDRELLWQRLNELRSCKEKCGQETREVQKFLDNINFYSKRKFAGCSAKCGSGDEEERNSCLWECYNRLDRRYKDYWANQRSNVEARHKI